MGLHSDIGGTVLMNPATIEVAPLAAWEDSPQAVARREFWAEDRTPIRQGMQHRIERKTSLTIWWRMLGRTYCLL